MPDSVEEHTKQVLTERAAAVAEWMRKLGDIELPPNAVRLAGGLRFEFDDGTGFIVQFQIPTETQT